MARWLPRLFLILATLVLAWAIPAAPALAEEVPPLDARFCVTPPYDRLCATLPYDQTDFDRHFVYMILVKGAQDPFDMFSWQAFVALNWPADASGSPRAAAIGQVPAAARVWQGFQRRDSVIGPDQASTACGAAALPGGPSGALLVDELEQADGGVLIDQARNFVVYDTRMNAVAADYIRSAGLDTRAGQQAFGADKAVAFPKGRLPDAGATLPGAAPTVMIKTSWRLLADPAEEARFLTVDGVVHVPAARSESGKDSCLPARLGLVGMHIVMRTHSGNGDEWIWSTFEHVDNVPLAANARAVNSIYAEELFPGGCQAPAAPPRQSYSFFDPDCPSCRTNSSAEGDWSWAAAPPYAQIAGQPARRGSQLVRCWKIFESTAAVNRRWQRRLAGTVWANYMLISTQWRGADKSPLFEHGEVPRFLTNTTMESFGQSDPNGTCLGCHAEATTAAGNSANFIFSLRNAR
ncbi:MAG: hypothetical protein ACFB13_22700 [Kiloniellaceae bacterium]